MATFVWAPEDEAKKAKLDRVKQQNAANIQSKPVASTWPAPIAAPVTPKIAEQWGSSEWIGMQKQPTQVKPVTPITPVPPTTTPPQQDKAQSELEQAYTDKTKAAEELALAKQRQGLEQDVKQVEQNKEAVAFTKKKQEAETKIRDLNIQSQNTKAQQNMDAAFQQMQNLKQNLAYIGSRWVPWKSAAQFDAMQRSLDDAQRTYNTLSQLEGQRKEMQDIGAEFDSVAYARQIKQLQDDLDSKVNTTVQDAINSFMQESWNIDTIDELKQLQDKYLDMVDTNLETMTSREVMKREALNEQYATRLEDARKKVENVGKIDTERSQMYWYYVDMNWNALLDASGAPIVHSRADVIEPYIDEGTWQLVRVTMWEDGQPVTTLTKVIDVPQVTQGALGDIKAAVAAGKLSVEDAVKLFPSLSRQPELLAQLAATAPTPQAEAPAPKTVTVDTPDGKQTYQYNEQTGRFDIPVWTNYETESGVPIQDAIATAVSQCANGAQCWEFINKVGKAAWVDLWIKDSYDSKVQAIQKIGEAQSLEDIDAWSIFAYPVDGSEYGHIGIVTSKNEDGSINIMDYNYNLDEKQRERTNVDYAEILNKGWSISKPLITDSTVDVPKWADKEVSGLGEYMIRNQPRWAGYSDEDVKAYTQNVKDMVKDGDREGLIQLYRDSVLKRWANEVMVQWASTLLNTIDSLNDDIASYVAKNGDTGIFSGTYEQLANKLWESSDPELASIGQRIGLLTADYIRSISGTAASDPEVARLIKLLPSTKQTVVLNNIYLKNFRDKVSNSAKSSLEVSIGNKYKNIAPELFPEIYGSPEEWSESDPLWLWL